MAKMRFNPYKGFKKHLQRRKELVKVVCKHSQTGLNFKPESKHWGKKHKMVNFKVTEKTTMILEYPDDPKLEETQNLIPPWASPEARLEN